MNNKWVDFIVEYPNDLDKNGDKELFFYIEDHSCSEEFDQQFYTNKFTEDGKPYWDEVEHETVVDDILDDYMPNKLLEKGCYQIVPKEFTVVDFIKSFEDSGMKFMEMTIPSVEISSLHEVKLSEMDYDLELIFRVYIA